MEWIAGVAASTVVAFFTAQFAARREKENLREELKLDYSIEAAIVQLLSEQGWKMRSFKTIKYHIRGFKDDELRQHLVRAGAIAFQQKPEDRSPDDPHRNDAEKLERWGLLHNVKDELARSKT